MSTEASDNSDFAGVLIDLGRYLDDDGKATGPWFYFIDYVFADGARITMDSVATHAEAMFNAEELAESADVPITDLTGGGRVH